mmetsp:Transcript_20073/g.30849  ORF Transcript_20073/g.30849 Transcript_20073/m.30849 type:complete len:99 (+) Transcript_20073:63-359(+)
MRTNIKKLNKHSGYSPLVQAKAEQDLLEQYDAIKKKQVQDLDKSARSMDDLKSLSSFDPSKIYSQITGKTSQEQFNERWKGVIESGTNRSSGVDSFFD